MGKRKILSFALFSTVLISSCGGGGGLSDLQSGFYTLDVSVSPSYITSPAVVVSQDINGNITAEIPPDTFDVSVSLLYDGTSQTPLRAIVKKAEICVENNCSPAPVSGILQAGQSKQLTVSVVSHKYGVPWIVINPVEDERISYSKQQTQTLGGVQTQTLTRNYYNTPLNFSIQPVVQKNSVVIETANATFNATQTYNNYQAGTQINIALYKGANPQNTILANSFKATVGNVVCVDDGNGNIQDQGGGNANCSGTINYTTGDLSITINADGNITFEYQVQGSLLCQDDGQGNITRDCTGTINYDTGEISNLSLKMEATAVPLSLTITYSQLTGTTDGINYFFTLPSDTYDSVNKVKTVYGREIYIYDANTNTLLCDNQGNENLCSITKQGNTVKITFNSRYTSSIYAEYSVESFIDFNPAINARDYNHLWNGQSTVKVSGTFRIQVELEDGNNISGEFPITFEVIPTQGGQNVQ